MSVYPHHGENKPLPKSRSTAAKHGKSPEALAAEPSKPNKPAKKAVAKAQRPAPPKTRPWTPAEVREAFSRFRNANPEPKGELEHLNPFTLLVAVVLSAQATDAGVNKATRALFQVADTPQKMLALGDNVVTTTDAVDTFNVSGKETIDVEIGRLPVGAYVLGTLNPAVHVSTGTAYSNGGNQSVGGSVISAEATVPYDTFRVPWLLTLPPVIWL